MPSATPPTTHDVEEANYRAERPGQSGAEATRRSVKITGYRMFNTFLTIAFISIKAACSIGAKINPALSTVSDWTLGGLVTLVMWWVGYLETVEPPVLPWFFHRDYAVVVACAVRYIFGAQNNLESPNSPDMSSPSQAYLELRSTPSSTSSSSSTAPTPSDTPSSPPYETVAPPDQAQPGPNTTDPIKSSQDERHTDGTAEETSPRADPAALEDSGPPQEQPLTNATPDDPRPQPYNDPPPLIVGRPEGDAAGNGPNSSCSPASSTNTAPLDSGLELEFGPSATIASGRVDNTGIRADTEPESLSWPATFPSPSEIFTSPTSDSTGQPQAEGTTSFALESSLESDVEVTGESFTAPGTSTPGDQTYVNLSSRGEIFSSAVERREGGTLRRRAGERTAVSPDTGYDRDRRYWVYLHDNFLRPHNIYYTKAQTGDDDGTPWITTLTIHGVSYTSSPDKTRDGSNNHAAYLALIGLRRELPPPPGGMGSGGKTQYVQQLNNYVQALDKAGQLSAWAKPEAVAEDRRTNGDYCATAVVNDVSFPYGPCNGKEGKRNAEEGAARKALMHFNQLPADQDRRDDF